MGGPSTSMMMDHHMVLFRVHGHQWRTFVAGPRVDSPETVAYVSQHMDDLSQFPVGKVAVADLLRFTQPSPVFDHCEPWTHGLSGDIRPGWSQEDVIKEGRFEEEMTSMVVRSYRDEARYEHSQGG